MTVDDLNLQVDALTKRVEEFLSRPQYIIDKKVFREILAESFKEEEKMKALNMLTNIELISSTIIIMLLVGIIFLMFFTEPI